MTMRGSVGSLAAALLLAAGLLVCGERSATAAGRTQAIVALVTDAARLVETNGESAFATLGVAGSRWRHDDLYVFVLDTDGNMLVHPDPALEGGNRLTLTDVNGKSIIRGLIETATALPDHPEGWYHYEWPVPGEILPRWKSSYVRLVEAPSGKRYVIGSGVYDDRMERRFVVDLVRDAVGLVEKRGEAAYAIFRDPKSRFIAKDAYVFVIDPTGVERVNPAFPNLEGRSLLGVQDTQGKYPVREMLELARSRDEGWVDYMWPKPGESVSTLKSAYVRRARLGDSWVLVGCGVYLADAPKMPRDPTGMTAPRLVRLVHAAAAMLETRGERAYPQMRTKGSKWFRDGTYFFVWSMNGTRVFHAADASLEGRNGGDAKDVLGRPYGRMFLRAASGPAGQGWIHYMYPEPGGLFPVWKSVFVQRVRYPSGDSYLVGAGSYNMQMDESFIVDVVDQAAAIVAARGSAAFAELRDKTGPFVFMDTYVFVDSPEGVELVNPAQPSLEGRNIIDLRDVTGKAVAREYITAASRRGSAWVEYEWYRPGDNTVAHKRAYVRKVVSGSNTYYVGSGLYLN